MSTDGIADAIQAFQADMNIPESDSAPVEEQSVEEVAPEADVGEDLVEENVTGDAEEVALEEETEEVSDVEEETEPELPSVEYVKADGKKVKIDYEDRDHIKRVYQKYAAQTRYQSERDSYKSQLDELSAQHSKQSEMVNLLNENIEDPAEMYRLFTGGKDIKEQFREWQKEEDNFALLTKSEQKAYLDSKRIAKQQKELDKREAAMNRKVQESSELEDRAKLEQQQALVTNSFEQHRFNEVTDVDEAHKLDKRLWNDIKSRLSEYDSINKEIIDREMKDAAEELRSLLGRRARVEEKKVVKAKKKVAKKAAAKAVAGAPKEEEPGFVGGLAEMMGFKL
jgi:hypothetical protein